MSYTLNITFDFGALTGLVLNGILFDSLGLQTGPTITTGFVELGQGVYSYLATIPDAHVGTLVAYKASDATIKAAVSINPQEVEYTNTKLSLMDLKLNAIDDYIDTEVAALTAAVGSISTAVGSLSSAQEIADVFLGRNLAGGSDGGRTVQDALRFLRNRWVRTATTLVVYTEDDTTQAWASTLTSSGSADPTVESNPA